MNDHLKKMVELLLAGQLVVTDSTHTPDGIGGSLIEATLLGPEDQEYRVFASSMDSTWMLDDGNNEYVLPANVQDDLTLLYTKAMVS